MRSSGTRICTQLCVDWHMSNSTGMPLSTSTP